MIYRISTPNGDSVFVIADSQREAAQIFDEVCSKTQTFKAFKTFAEAEAAE